MKERAAHGLAAYLAALAGYIDAVGFIETHGFFVSFMTGNITRLGVGWIDGQPVVAIAAGLIAAFVVGVMAGTAVAEVAGRHRRPAVLGFVTLCLGIGAGAEIEGYPVVSVAALTLAMGAMNAVFDPDGNVKVGLTYMTGTLVKLGQAFTAFLFGRPNWAWFIHFAMWVALGAGAVLGALAHKLGGLDASLLIAAAAGLAATIAGAVLKPWPKGA